MPKYCIKCGAAIPNKSVFCQKCGADQTQFYTAQQESAPPQTYAKEIHRPAFKSVLILISLVGLLAFGSYLVFLGTTNATLSTVDYSNDRSWTNINDWGGGGYLNVSSGALRIYQTSNSGNSAKTVSSTAYGVWQLRFKLGSLGGCDYTRMIWYFIKNNNTNYYVQLGGDAPYSDNRIILGSQDKRFVLTDIPLQGEWHTLKITRDTNGQFKIFIDDTERLNYTDNTITASTDTVISGHRNCGYADVYASDIRIGGYASGINMISVLYIVLGASFIIASMVFLLKRKNWWKTVIKTKEINLPSISPAKPIISSPSVSSPSIHQSHAEEYLEAIPKNTTDFYIRGAKAGAIAGAVDGAVGSIIGGILTAIMLPIIINQFTANIANSFGFAGQMFGMYANMGAVQGLAQVATAGAMLSGVISGLISGAIWGAIFGAIICFGWEWPVLGGKTPFMKAFVARAALFAITALMMISAALLLPFGYIALIAVPAILSGLVSVFIYAKLFDRFLKKPLF